MLPQQLPPTPAISWKLVYVLGRILSFSPIVTGMNAYTPCVFFEDATLYMKPKVEECSYT